MIYKVEVRIKTRIEHLCNCEYCGLRYEDGYDVEADARTVIANDRDSALNAALADMGYTSPPEMESEPSIKEVSIPFSWETNDTDMRPIRASKDFITDGFIMAHEDFVDPIPEIHRTTDAWFIDYSFGLPLVKVGDVGVASTFKTKDENGALGEKTIALQNMYVHAGELLGFELRELVTDKDAENTPAAWVKDGRIVGYVMPMQYGR